MSTTITQVNVPKITHASLIDLTLNDVTYYVSSAYKPVVFNGKTYIALAGLLSVSEIQGNISNSGDEIQIGLSAIPSEYIQAILGQPIKGGSVSVYRAFFDETTQQFTTAYKRFTGVISNFSVQEDIDPDTNSPTATHSITVICSSIMGVLENKFSGRRTNSQDYQNIFWPAATGYPLWHFGFSTRTVNTIASNVITFASNHNLKVNDKIYYYSASANGLIKDTMYYVASVPAANQVTVSLYVNGPAATLVDGTGLSLTFRVYLIFEDPSFDRVDTLHNNAFDFGRPYRSTAGNSTGNTSSPPDSGLIYDRPGIDGGGWYDGG